MKSFVLLSIVLALGFTSCKKEKASTAAETQNLALEDATVVLSGDLLFSLKTNTGSARILQQKNNKYVLGLEKMNVNPAKSFVIYLSTTETMSSSSIKICSVINLNGDAFHVLPDHIDFSLFKHLIILAEPSEELVASAELN
jgi:hypothetical protein